MDATPFAPVVRAVVWAVGAGAGPSAATAATAEKHVGVPAPAAIEARSPPNISPPPPPTASLEAVAADATHGRVTLKGNGIEGHIAGVNEHGPT